MSLALLRASWRAATTGRGLAFAAADAGRWMSTGHDDVPEQEAS